VGMETGMGIGLLLGFKSINDIGEKDSKERAANERDEEMLHTLIRVV
jgi:hypothetical protein